MEEKKKKQNKIKREEKLVASPCLINNFINLIQIKHNVYICLIILNFSCIFFS
jgi:hypothetical protein